MNRRRVSAILLATSLVAATIGPAVAQSNTAQAIRYGEIVALDRTVIQNKPSSTGAAVGATAGAVAGYALADYGDRWLGGMLGGVLGGAVGGAASRSASKKKGWQLIIKIEGGQEIGVQVPGKKTELKVGQRVRIFTGAGGRTEVKPADG